MYVKFNKLNNNKILKNIHIFIHFENILCQV